jgi:hypothetical protein
LRCKITAFFSYTQEGVNFFKEKSLARYFILAISAILVANVSAQAAPQAE